jgi:hypothetical protein
MKQEEQLEIPRTMSLKDWKKQDKEFYVFLQGCFYGQIPIIIIGFVRLFISIPYYNQIRTVYVLTSIWVMLWFFGTIAFKIKNGKLET